MTLFGETRLKLEPGAEFSLSGVFLFCPCHCFIDEGKTHFFFICFPISPTHSSPSHKLFQLLPPLFLFLALDSSSRAPPPLMNSSQPEEETALVGEEVEASKTGGVGEEAFAEEYVTGDVGLKEYDYSYRDYSEPRVETGGMDGGMGPALSAVTDEGGVSPAASGAKRNLFQLLLKLSQRLLL